MYVIHGIEGKFQFVYFSFPFRRGGIWDGRWRRWNHSGPLAGSVLDRHQLVLWWERSCAAATGLVRRVYSNVGTENCGGLPTNRLAGRGTTYIRGCWNTGKDWGVNSSISFLFYTEVTEIRNRITFAANALGDVSYEELFIRSIMWSWW